MTNIEHFAMAAMGALLDPSHLNSIYKDASINEREDLYNLYIDKVVFMSYDIALKMESEGQKHRNLTPPT